MIFKSLYISNKLLKMVAKGEKIYSPKLVTIDWNFVLTGNAFNLIPFDKNTFMEKN